MYCILLWLSFSPSWFHLLLSLLCVVHSRRCPRAAFLDTDIAVLSQENYSHHKVWTVKVPHKSQQSCHYYSYRKAYRAWKQWNKWPWNYSELKAQSSRKGQIHVTMMALLIQLKGVVGPFPIFTKKTSWSLWSTVVSWVSTWVRCLMCKVVKGFVFFFNK